MNGEPAQSVSKRGRLGEGRLTKRTPEVVAKIAEAVVIGLTDEGASLRVEIDPEIMTEWRKDPEFSGAIKRATAERLLMRLERIEAGEQGWQGTAWACNGIKGPDARTIAFRGVTLDLLIGSAPPTLRASGS